MKRVTRPALRWHGGKFRLSPWIIRHFPPHRIYVEPFGGAASVLLKKPRAYAEIYNDLDDEVVNLFRVLQDNTGADRLRQLLDVTPFARREFEIAWERASDPIERARRLIIRSFMGFGSNAHNNGPGRNSSSTGFRANSNRSRSTPAHDWMAYPTSLEAVIDRLRGVVIENRDAVEVMNAQDSDETLHYVDPPYLPETRSRSSRGTAYTHEMTREDHANLLTAIRSFTGMVVVSGYHDEMYDDMLHDWIMVETEALADGARKRTEVIWINQKCHGRLIAAGHQVGQDMLFPHSRRVKQED